jgi:transmembrane sensor
VDNKENIRILVSKYLDRSCKEAEINQFLRLFDQRQNEILIKAYIKQYFESANEFEQNDKAREDEAIENVHARLISRINKKQIAIKHMHLFKVAVACLILISLSFAPIYFIYFSKNQNHIANVQKQDIEPGGNKGILTLSDGSQIILEKVNQGDIATQGDATIKNISGKLIYDVPTTKKADVYYNKLTVPRGGQYQLTLPDGTNVWLNAASSIDYPTVFKGKERRVRITGEVYFEVAPYILIGKNGENERIPFIVDINNQVKIKVLGTHFNLSSYPEEKITEVTLIEGSVEVNSLVSNETTAIRPGQQASIDAGGRIMIKEVDTEEVVAWKNGLFYFNNANLQTVMQQLARWYDVQIKYEGNVPNRIFTGKIHRDINLSEALEILKFTKVNFRIDNKCIIVTP